jgi:hypothetical protein
MKPWMVMPLVFGLAGCTQRQASLDDEPAPTETSCVVAALPGGNGGHGGLLALIVAGELPAVLELGASGGVGAPGGAFEQGPDTAAGQAGDGGVVEITQDAEYLFDATGIVPGTRVAVGVGGENVLAVAGSEAMPIVRVERFELGEGTTLAVSRFATIEAQELVIARGARLLLRDVGVSSMSIGAGEFEDGGLSGGHVTIRARRLSLEGTIDASGSDGEAGRSGGHGGQLSIASETVEMGADATISVNGGNGGAGDDERACAGQ